MMNYKHISAILIIFATSIFLLQGCSKKDEPLSVGIHEWAGYDTLLIANDFKYLPDHITLIKDKNSINRINSLKNGTIQAGTFTLGEVLLARSYGVPIQIVMLFDTSAGGDSVLSCEKLEKLSDIKGKRVAYEDSTISRVLLFKLLEAANLKESDVTLIPISQDTQAMACKNREADIFITYEPAATKIFNLGGSKIFDSRQIPNTIIDVLAVHKENIKGKEESVKALIRAHFRTLDRIQTNYDDFIYRIAYYENSDYADAKKTLRGIHFSSLNENYELLSAPTRLNCTLSEVNKILVKQKIIKEDMILDDIFTTKYLPPEQIK